MTNKSYMNLHAHSTSSLLDGMSKFDEYAARAKSLGMPGMTFTEHGNLHGLLDGYDAATKHGLKYFPGLEAYQARKTRFDMDEEERAGKETEEWKQRGPHHLGLIAYNNVGYHNLIKLSSRAFLEGYYVKPRVDFELLEEHHEGLVCLSGCLSGMVQQALLRGATDEAFKIASRFQDIFGKENFFIEVQNHGIQEQLDTMPGLVTIASQLDAPIVATCDCHYTCKEHALAHDVLLCTNTKSRIDTPNRFKFHEDHFYLKSYEEMAQLFPEEWLDNTMLIYEKHDLDLKFGDYHIPNFAAPAGRTQDEHFVAEVYNGAEERFGSDWRHNTAVAERIEYEIGVIKEMGFPNYFLIVSDIMKFAHNQGIMCGAGRGSAAGSIVAYCLYITQVNPLDYNLPFERFLVPGRKTMPDIDLDIDDRYREILIDYTRAKYGYDHTAQICTMSEIGAKSAIKDVARVLNYDFSVPTKINDAMPPALFGVSKTIDECLATDSFRQLYESDEDCRKIIDLAKQFEGLWRQTGVHAAGLIVSDKPITEYMPVMQKGKDAPVITQWGMERVEQCGMLKIDFLGLRNLSIVDMTFELLEKQQAKPVPTYTHKYQRYDLAKEFDYQTYESLQKGENSLVFQLESPGIRQVMVGLRPSNVEDIAALLSLYRPGPMASNVHSEYIERKHGRKPVTYVHPKLEPILKETYGLLLYQEQLLRIAREIAGFSVGDADYLRKAVGKKKPEEMKKWRERFVVGCVQTSEFTHALATSLFDEIEHHASYSFSKNHAVSYAYLSVLTAWLRANHPVEAMAAGLSSVVNKEDRLRLYLNECKRLGITVLPPSVNLSEPDFSIRDEKTIQYGFNGVKGIGGATVNALGTDNNRQQFTGLYDFFRNANVDLLARDFLSHMLNAGGFDELVDELEHIIPKFDFTRSQKHKALQDELNELGVFLSDHPLNDVQDLVMGKTTHTIKDLVNYSAGTKVRVAGVVLDITKKMTRNGRRMYQVTIDDLEASVYVAIMPKVAAEYPDPPFEKGAVIVVEGRIEKFNDEDNSAITIGAHGMEVIDTSGLTGGKPIILHVSKNLSGLELDKINDIIKTERGNCPVYLEFRDGRQKMKMKFNDLTTSGVGDQLQELVKVMNYGSTR